MKVKTGIQCELPDESVDQLSWTMFVGFAYENTKTKHK